MISLGPPFPRKGSSGRSPRVDLLGHPVFQSLGGRVGAAQPNAAAGSPSGPSSRERAPGGGKAERERERRRYRAPVAPVAPSASAVCPGEPAQYRHSRGHGWPNPTGSRPGSASAKGCWVGCTVLQELTGGGSKRVRVCSVSRSPDFSTVTTEGEVSEAQRLLTRKPVRDSEMEQCCCWTTARVYIQPVRDITRGYVW